VDLEFTDDQEELRGAVKSFLEKECPIDLVRAVVETGEAPEKLWPSMVALDWPGLAIPEDCGGVGLSFVETAVVVEELGRVVAPGPFLATTTQFAPVVRELGSEDQRQHYLGAVASGAITGALALADHPRRWGVADVTTRAEKSGSGWRITGTKFGVLADPTTDEVVVVARSDDGVGAFIVPGAECGLAPVHSLDMSRPLFTAELRGVEISAERVLGEPGSASTLSGLTRALEESILATALETVGTSDALFQLVLAYVKDRQQFSVPIGSFQAIKHKMADMFVAIERARALCYFAVAAIEEDAEGRAIAVAMAKSASDDCQRLVCQDSFQSFGGIGYTWEHDGHLFIKRAETTGALFGGTRTQTLLIAESLGVTAAI
jgi:alkylation response protein AidB-like acyl-CoA dehydrogenase